MPHWRKSSYSDIEGNCVQLARLAHGIGVRDSKNPDGGFIAMGPETFGKLMTCVKAGQSPR